MTKKQLQQLIHDGDISPGFVDRDTALKDYDSSKFYDLGFIESGRHIHLVSNEIHEIVEASYFVHLNDLYCKDRMKGFAYVVEDRLHYWPKSKERHIRLLEDGIEELSRIKDEMKLDKAAVLFCQHYLVSDKYCNVAGTIECHTENYWRCYVYENGMEIIKILKFDVFKGEKIELTSTVNITTVASAFYHLGADVLQEIFENMLV